MSEALLVNFGTASSISTYPVTLACLTKKNELPPGVASFALSLGVLINICRWKRKCYCNFLTELPDQ